MPALHVEEQSKNPIFVDEFTEVGLFQQLKSSSGSKAIIRKEEAAQLFEQILGVKEKCKLDEEQLIQLYDGTMVRLGRTPKATSQSRPHSSSLD